MTEKRKNFQRHGRYANLVVKAQKIASWSRLKWAIWLPTALNWIPLTAGTAVGED